MRHLRYTLPTLLTLSMACKSSGPEDILPDLAQVESTLSICGNGRGLVFAKTSNGDIGDGDLGPTSYSHLASGNMGSFTLVTSIPGTASTTTPGAVGFYYASAKQVKFARIGTNGVFSTIYDVTRSSDPTWTHMMAGAKYVFSYDSVGGKGALDDYHTASGTTPTRVFAWLSPGSFGTWTHVLPGDASHEVLFYNSSTGATVLASFASTGLVNVVSPAAFKPAGTTFTHVASVGINPRDTIFYESGTGQVEIVRYNTAGGMARIRSMRVESGHTHVVGRNNGVALFYKGSTGTAQIYRMDTGALTAQSGFTQSWSHIVSAGDDAYCSCSISEPCTCSDTQACPSGWVCEAGTTDRKCRPSCTTLTDCPSGYASCSAGACMKGSGPGGGCISDADCTTAGNRCDKTTHLCTACAKSYEECSSNDYCCPGAFSYCRSGYGLCGSCSNEADDLIVSCVTERDCCPGKWCHLEYGVYKCREG